MCTTVGMSFALDTHFGGTISFFVPFIASWFSLDLVVILNLSEL
jgi:hypothetical protein